MEDNLIELLESFGYPVFRQGSMAQDATYPDTFLTFWNNEETEHSAYDNDTTSIDYSYMVNAYSTSPNLAYSLLREAKTLFKTNGWIITTFGYDAASDVVTHIGRGMSIDYIEY